MTGKWPRVGEAAFWSDPITVAVLLGLTAAAAGALVAALASAVPGREPLARVGRISAGSAAVWLIGCGLWAVGGGESESAASLFAGSASCLAHGLVPAIRAALAAGFYLSRGALRFNVKRLIFSQRLRIARSLFFRSTRRAAAIFDNRKRAGRRGVRSAQAFACWLLGSVVAAAVGEQAE